MDAAEPYFEQQSRVTVQELLDALEGIAKDTEDDPVVEAEYQAFVKRHQLPHSDALRRDFVRVRLAFEATRDGGFWHLRWKITNRKPNSEMIWSQWRSRSKPPKVGSDDPSAVAECDELSALFAFVARGLGVDHIGLFWPQWNHVVAVWTVTHDDGTRTRVVVPTSQIFLDPDATLGTDQFNPYKQKRIYTYKRRDAKASTTIPAELARFFVEQTRRHATLSSAKLQELRNARSALLGGS